jgi:hypothetical protein
LVDAIKNDMVSQLSLEQERDLYCYGYQGSKEKQVKRIILTRPARQRILVFFLAYEEKLIPCHNDAFYAAQ